MNPKMISEARELRARMGKMQKELSSAIIEGEEVGKAVNDAIEKTQQFAGRKLKEITGGVKIPGLT